MLLVTTFDESTIFGGNVIYSSFYGPYVKPGSVYNDTINHYSILRTIEDGLGLRRLGASAGARPLTPLLRAR
jgi:hypothetical protein